MKQCENETSLCTTSDGNFPKYGSEAEKHCLYLIVFKSMIFDLDDIIGDNSGWISTFTKYYQV